MKRTALLLTLIVLLAACAPPASAPTPTPAPVDETSPAVQAAVAMLAEALGLNPADIMPVSAEAVEWPDSCLGISYPNARCAQAGTPGYRLVLEAGGDRYVIHTNADGSAAVAAAPSLTWHREGGIAGFCDELYVSAFGQAQPSSCGRAQEYPSGTLTDAERALLTEWGQAFGSVVIEQRDTQVSDAMGFVLIMTGTGTGQPSEAEQQAMLDWAQDVFTRLAY